jgi:uncharacterized protein YecE (DUF72 family)
MLDTVVAGSGSVLRVGCPMWAYKAWQGLHFPEHLSRAEQLPTYATWCNAVEGNTTFYGLPAERTVTAWAREAPADFRFMFKLPRQVTHEHHLRDVAEEMREFLRRIEPLGERAEQLSIQLPPSFGPDDLDTLTSFIRRLPHSHRFAVELRHPGFYENPDLETAVETVLQHANVEWLNLDTATLYSHEPPSGAERGARRQKPRLPRRFRALTDHPVIRFVGVDDPDTSRVGWQPWLPVLTDWLRHGSTPTVFIHTPDNLDAPALARQLHADVAGLDDSLRPLPNPHRAQPATEQTLF